MARGVRVAGLAVGAFYLSGAGGFVAAVACVLAVVTVATALCVTHFRKERKARGEVQALGPMDSPSRGFCKLPPKSPGRAIINTLSSKRLFLTRKGDRSGDEELKAYDRAVMEGGEFLWQRNILMGERCQPPDFSGVIIYDDKGNRVPQFPPRSPRATVFHPSLEESNRTKKLVL